MTISSGPISKFELFELLPLELQKVIWALVGFRVIDNIIISKAIFPILREIFSQQRVLKTSYLAAGLSINSTEILAQEILAIGNYYAQHHIQVLQHSISALKFLNLLKNFLPYYKKELYFCDKAIYYINKSIINTVLQNIHGSFYKKRIKVIDLSNRHLTLFQINPEDWTLYKNSIPKLFKLNLDNNCLRFLFFPVVNSTMLATLVEFSARNNHLKYIPEGLEQFPKLKFIDLSFNKIEVVYNIFPSNKTTLILSHNKLSKLFETEIFPEKICLDYNKLEFIPKWLPLNNLYKLNQNLIEPTTLRELLNTQSPIKNHI